MSVLDPAPTRVCSNKACRKTAAREEFTSSTGRILRQCASCRRKTRSRVEAWRLRRPQASPEAAP